MLQPDTSPQTSPAEAWGLAPDVRPTGQGAGHRTGARPRVPGLSLAGWASSRELVYPSTDDRGEPRRYSGRVYLPPLRLNRRALGVPLVVFVHATEARRDQVPHFNRGAEALAGALAATCRSMAVAMPDLPGCGLDPSPRPHPFCHARSLAVSVLDMIAPALRLLDREALFWDGRVFLLGYSSGGYAALAAVKEWQINPRYRDLPLSGAACLAGPFLLAETIRGRFLADTPYAHPDIVPMLASAYHDLYPQARSMALDQCLHPRLLEAREGGLDHGSVRDWLGGADGSRTLCRKLNQRITGSPRQAPPARDLLHPRWLETQALAAAWPNTEVGALLRENTLVGGWCPRVPILLGSSPADECVPPENTQALLKDWARLDASARVTCLPPLTFRGRGLSHTAAAMPALAAAFHWCSRQP